MRPKIFFIIIVFALSRPTNAEEIQQVQSSNSALVDQSELTQHQHDSLDDEYSHEKEGGNSHRHDHEKGENNHYDHQDSSQDEDHHKEDSHDENHNQHEDGDHGGHHDHHEEKFGPNKAIQAVKRDGLEFKLSESSIKRLGIQTSSLTATNKSDHQIIHLPRLNDRTELKRFCGFFI